MLVLDAVERADALVPRVSKDRHERARLETRMDGTVCSDRKSQSMFGRG